VPLEPAEAADFLEADVCDLTPVAQ
jgi:hypothetical protein